ncbi:tetratricopeptide repeat protein [Treponema sp.]|uniref:tetratricopeptide repeat protein n=1 Tax=Treponema sp. TaxID=166 RepID=UPI0025E22A19|nr:tetratricopeptide repeat protein [Treponema sp.]MCR5218548.1 tetratricopeptide repeat protein [Treponema sp.]
MKKFLCAVSILGAAAFLTVSCGSNQVENTQPAVQVENVQQEEVQPVNEAEFSKEGFISEVKALARSGDYEGALSLYDSMNSKTKKKYANDLDIFILRAQLLQVTDRLEAARDQVDLLLKKHSKNEELKQMSFSIRKTLFMEKLSKELESGSDESALALYEGLDAELKDDFSINLIKASLLTGAGKYDEALAECDHLDSVEAGRVEVMEIRLAIMDIKGDSKDRNAMLQKIIKKDPYNAPANVALGQSSAIKKQYGSAKQYYLKALAKEPQNQDALFGLGQMEYYLENDAAAEKSLKKLLEINPDNAQAYSYLGKLAYANDKYVIALSYVEKALALEPDNYDYNLDCGMYNRYMGHFAEAEKFWSKCVELQPDYFLAYVYRAGIYDEQEKLDLALEDYKVAVKLNPKYYYAYESIGILELHNKNWKAAGEAFFEARKHNLNNISYPLLVTYCYYMLGDKKQAKKYSNDILRKMGNINSIDYKMLRVYHDENGYQNLPQQIGNMSNLNDRAKMYFYLGLLYDMFGSKSAAKEYYAKVLELNSPMFFEYRIAEWAVKEIPQDE